MGYYNSFVVRIWSDDRGRLRGKIEHVTSRATMVFVVPEAVVGFIRGHLDPPHDAEAFLPEIGMSDQERRDDDRSRHEDD